VKVAVVGAGIGGLCLAHGLLRAGADVTVYERDETLDSRGQGYRLHLDSWPALHACLPPDLYELCVATSGRPSTAMTVMTERLRPLRRTEIKPPADPLDPAALSTSVNRQTLREILAARLDGAIEFGRTCTGFEQDSRGVTVCFSDGRSAHAEILVAADGIGSPIRRRYLPHARLEDSGIVCLYGRTPLTGQTRPLVPPSAWDGFTAVAGNKVGMAIGVLDFSEPPERAARRLVPDVHLSPAQSYLMWAGQPGDAARRRHPRDEPRPRLRRQHGTAGRRAARQRTRRRRPGREDTATGHRRLRATDGRLRVRGSPRLPQRGTRHNHAPQHRAPLPHQPPARATDPLRDGPI
jgi:2-polyprenyl-6-methoxyphenol hydroxylase-like FAD-dependent oxidoreductase